MDYMSKMSPKSAYPFFPCASLPIVPNIHLAKWPLPFTHAETGYLPLLTLLPLGYTGVLGWADHGLIQVLSSLSAIPSILGNFLHSRPDSRTLSRHYTCIHHHPEAERGNLFRVLLFKA